MAVHKFRQPNKNQYLGTYSRQCIHSPFQNTIFSQHACKQIASLQNLLLWLNEEQLWLSLFTGRECQKHKINEFSGKVFVCLIFINLIFFVFYYNHKPFYEKVAGHKPEKCQVTWPKVQLDYSQKSYTEVPYYPQPHTLQQEGQERHHIDRWKYDK